MRIVLETGRLLPGEMQLADLGPRGATASGLHDRPARDVSRLAVARMCGERADGQRRTWGLTVRSHRDVLFLGAFLLVQVGCSRVPPHVIQIQGTVTSVGFRLPVPGAEVIVEWPVTLGGGTTVVRTDTDGRYAVRRSVRIKDPVCRGIAITVRAPGFASAYSRPDASCDARVLTFDFGLFPLPG